MAAEVLSSELITSEEYHREESYDNTSLIRLEIPTSSRRGYIFKSDKFKYHGFQVMPMSYSSKIGNYTERSNIRHYEKSPDEILKDKFYSLAEKWKYERGATSSVTKMSMHPAYQQIIGMGAAVVPLILEELEREPDHWFWALNAILGVDPVPKERRGKIKEMAKAWVQWGYESGYLQ